MRLTPPIYAVVAATLLAACASTPARRIDSDRAAFNQFPSPVQEKIRAGEVAAGFTPEMVRLAWGPPDRVYTRRTEQGDTEVWSYRSGGSRVSFGFGFGSFGRHSATSVGVGTTMGGWDRGEVKRVEFRDGQVIASEIRAR
jgi:hypothetical protein